MQTWPKHYWTPFEHYLKREFTSTKKKTHCFQITVNCQNSNIPRKRQRFDTLHIFFKLFYQKDNLRKINSKCLHLCFHSCTMCIHVYISVIGLKRTTLFLMGIFWQVCLRFVLLLYSRTLFELEGSLEAIESNLPSNEGFSFYNSTSS